MSEIKIVDPSEAVLDEHDGVVTRRLIRSDHGAHSMSFGTSTLPEGLDDPAATYPDHDEIVYIVSGIVEVTVDGLKHRLGKGKTIFIPRGKTYGYKVVEGPNEVIVAFSPARY